MTRHERKTSKEARVCKDELLDSIYRIGDVVLRVLVESAMSRGISYV